MYAVRMPIAANMPALRSQIGTPSLVGASPGWPLTLISPLMPCATRSKPPRFAYGPVMPKPEMVQ